MTSDLQKVAIVTGGSRGIGAAISQRLAADGFAVIVGFHSNKEEADKVVQFITDNGGKAIARAADVADPKAVAKLFDDAEAEFGGVDVVVNNAGIMKLAPIEKTSDEFFDAHIAANLKGVFNGMREAVRRVRSGGRIINMSSSVVRLKLENYAVYAATKAAVETMTAIAAKELRGRDVTVNAIAPGPTATELFLNGKPPEIIERLKGISPMQRLGEPDDIANIASFLASAESTWVNGQIIYANGGAI